MRGASDGSWGDRTIVEPTSMVGDAIAKKARDVAKCKSIAAAPECSTPQQGGIDGRPSTSTSAAASRTARCSPRMP
jgi:hypothetical protein